MQPPNGTLPNAPQQNYFRTQIYYDKKYPVVTCRGARPSQKVIVPSDVAPPLPKSPKLHALDPGAMVVVVLGQTFHKRDHA